MSAKTRNDRCKIAVGSLDPIARLVLAAGLVKPIFASGPDDFLTVTGAILVAAGIWGLVAYLTVTLEDEE